MSLPQHALRTPLAMAVVPGMGAAGGSGAGLTIVCNEIPSDSDGTDGTDGSIVIIALNTASSTGTVSYSPSSMGIASGTAMPYMATRGNDAVARSVLPVGGGTFTVSVLARSLMTYVVATGRSTTSPSVNASPSSHSSTCKVVAYPATSQWPGGFAANVMIANPGRSAGSGGTLGFTFAWHQEAANVWNASVAQSGELVGAVNLGYGVTISSGGTALSDFRGTWTSSDSPPTDFPLNGAACST